MEKKKGYEESVKLSEGVQANFSNRIITLKGEKGENSRKIENPQIDIEVKDNEVIIKTIKSTKREKKIVFTLRAHIRNMCKGVTEGHKYVLKICSGHFPMNVTVNNNQLIIKNFIGEKNPRVLGIKEGVNAKVEGDLINIESVDKEKAGTCASDIEKLTRRPGFDKRIFQDGIYITVKDGKELK